MKDKSGMTLCAERLVRIDPRNPPPGRFDPERVGKTNPKDKEPRPIVTEADVTATRVELARQKRPSAGKRA
jgi:hypothetical protein